MYFSDRARLIASKVSYDEIGNTTKVETEKEVFCDVKKVGQNEFYKAQTTDLKPELQVVVWNDDYSGETEICVTCSRLNIKNKRYYIYRSYSDEEKTELYLSEKIGAINGI